MWTDDLLLELEEENDSLASRDCVDAAVQELEEYTNIIYIHYINK